MSKLTRRNFLAGSAAAATSVGTGLVTDEDKNELHDAIHDLYMSQARLGIRINNLPPSLAETVDGLKMRHQPTDLVDIEQFVGLTQEELKMWWKQVSKRVSNLNWGDWNSISDDKLRSFVTRLYDTDILKSLIESCDEEVLLRMFKLAPEHVKAFILYVAYDEDMECLLPEDDTEADIDFQRLCLLAVTSDYSQSGVAYLAEFIKDEDLLVKLASIKPNRLNLEREYSIQVQRAALGALNSEENITPELWSCFGHKVRVEAFKKFPTMTEEWFDNSHTQLTHGERRELFEYFIADGHHDILMELSDDFVQAVFLCEEGGDTLDEKYLRRHWNLMGRYEYWQMLVGYFEFPGDLLLKLVKEDISFYEDITEPTPEVDEYVFSKKPEMLRGLYDIGESVRLDMVSRWPEEVLFISEPTPEIMLAAVKQCPQLIVYFNDPPVEVVEEAARVYMASS